MKKLDTSAFAFPESALVGSLGDLARVLADGTEVPEEFYFACGLTVLGSIVGRRLNLDIGFDVDPRLYTVLVGESYSVKKSTAMKKTISFFSNHDIGPPRVLYGVGSAEGLGQELTSGPQALLAYDELRQFVDKCQVKGSTLLAMVTTLFEGNTWQNTIKSRKASLHVKNARLSLLACCTLDTYSDIWKPDAVAIGFPNRLFLVNADRRGKVAWPAPPDEARLSAIADRIEAQVARLPRDFGITDDARRLWEAWYAADRHTEHARRLDTIGFRLLALIALSTDKDVIDADTVGIVTKILDYELSIRMLTDPIDADSTIAQLEEGIRRKLRALGPLSKRELRQKVHADRKGLWAFNTALQNLQQAEDIVVQDDKWVIAQHENDEAA